MSSDFNRRKKENQPVLAICYDFDKTLSPDDMQAQGFIQSVGYDVEKFWNETNLLAEENDMDQNLAYMFMMKDRAEGNLVFTRAQLENYGAHVHLFHGVRDWFRRIRQYGKEHGVIVEHYIISSGLKEMIEGTEVADEFEKIYASSFYYNQKGVAIWPAQVVNYTNKTQFLFRIEKGVLDVNDPGVNEAFAPEDIRVPFRNMVYIGDSDTDVPCMRLVNQNGGHSVGVYNAQSMDKTKVYKMMRENRIKYFVPADYSDGKPLDELLKKIIDKTAASEALEAMHYEDKRELFEHDGAQDGEERKKTDLIIQLENSVSYAATHAIVAELLKMKDWTEMQRQQLYTIALENSQVGCVMKDRDVRHLYTELLNRETKFTAAAQEVEAKLYQKERE